jgi:hypothetical protein
MPDPASPGDYYDGDLAVAVLPPTESRPSIRLAARANGIACRVDLTAAGADHIGRALTAAAAAAVAAYERDEEEPER